MKLYVSFLHILLLLVKVSNRISAGDGMDVTSPMDEIRNEFVSQMQNPTKILRKVSADLHDIHYLIVSTMDGQITAFDVNKNGYITWVKDVDNKSLLSGTLYNYQMTNERSLMAIPALDGSLFTFDASANSLSPIVLCDGRSTLLGRDAVAGASTFTSTGIDLITGKILYRCTSETCERNNAEQTDVPHTLLIQRKDIMMRAADPISGEEKWNSSVGSYSVSLITNESVVHNTGARMLDKRFLFSLPDGIVSTFDGSMNIRWQHKFKVPIATAWEVRYGRLSEISLFDRNNVQFAESDDQMLEAVSNDHDMLFYFGSFNDIPYLMSSDKLRQELNRNHHPQRNTDIDVRNRPLHLDEFALVNIVKRSYLAYEMGENFQSVISNSKDSCYAPMFDRMNRVQQAGLGIDEESGNTGWYILRSSSADATNARQINMIADAGSSNLLLEDSEKSRRRRLLHNVRKHLRVDGPVSGWWRVISYILGSGITIVLLPLFRKYNRSTARTQRDQYVTLDLRKVPCNLTELMDALAYYQKHSKSIENNFHTCSGNSSTQVSSSDASTSQYNPTETYVSKFLDDFVAEKWLGRGGYGIVIKCRNRLDDRSYAIKRIAVSNSKSAIEKVLREVRTMAKLDHPGIIRYFHTWLESPPEDWQQAIDDEVLRNIQSQPNSTENSLFSDGKGPRYIVTSSQKQKLETVNTVGATANSIIESVKQIFTGASFGGKDENSCGSWADGYSSHIRSKEDSDSSSSASGDDGPPINAISNEDSFPIIFTNSSNNVESVRSLSMDFGPPAILIAGEKGLRDCIKKKNYSYLYIQMELCQEMTLFNWLVRNTAKEDRNINLMRNWLAQLVCAINYIHKQGLIHRDLKPQNIFFSAADSCTLKIGDLGLATNYINNENYDSSKAMFDEKHTNNVGTMLYMSPEQLNGKLYNEKVDIFSLGLIYMEMVIPFKTMMERCNTLRNLQKGITPKALIEESKMEQDFIAWLTKLDVSERPSCPEILGSVYLHSCFESMNTVYSIRRSRCPSTASADL